MGLWTMPLIADLIRDLHRKTRRRSRLGGRDEGGLAVGVCVVALFKQDFVLTCETFIGVTHPLTESTNLNAFINNIEEMTS